MTLRKPILIATVAAFCLCLASCGSMRRWAKDGSVVLLSPVIIPYAGFTDGFSDAKDMREGLDANPVYEVIAMPFTSLFGVVKHTVFIFFHAVDFFALPIYGAAELHPYGPEVEPLDYYTGTIFDRPQDENSSTDADSGEEKR